MFDKHHGTPPTHDARFRHSLIYPLEKFAESKSHFGLFLSLLFCPLSYLPPTPSLSLSFSLQWPKCNLLCLHLSEHLSCQPRTRSWLHLVSADSSPLCLWLFGSQSALAKHATETCKEPLPRLATAQLATSTQRELKPTFCPGGKQRERLTLPNPSSRNAPTCASCAERMNASSNRFMARPWIVANE